MCSPTKKTTNIRKKKINRKGKIRKISNLKYGKTRNIEQIVAQIKKQN